MPEAGENREFAAMRPAADMPASWRHQALPWLIAGGINLLIFALLMTTARIRIDFGYDVPSNVIPVVILSEAPAAAIPLEDPMPEPIQPEPIQPAPIQPEPELRESAPVDPPPLAPEPSPEPEPENLPPAEPFIPEPVPAAPVQAAPQIDLAERGAAGGPSGITAIYCPDEFDDPDKAAECAGRPEILSGWKYEDEDWSDMAAALRRGGVNVKPSKPYIGAPHRRPLADNESYYEPFDEGLIIGRDAAKRNEMARKGEWLKDPRREVASVMDTASHSMSNLGDAEVTNYITDTWQPSWTLREEPELSLDDIERIRIPDESGN